jgi:hypothetical protein
MVPGVGDSSTLFQHYVSLVGRALVQRGTQTCSIQQVNYFLENVMRKGHTFGWAQL